MRRPAVFALTILLLGAPLVAQAPPNLALARVRYNTLKTNVKPAGELKAQIDAIDKEIAEALRLGQASHVRRLIAKGTALLNQRAWTDEDDFDQSLVLRSDRVFVDTSMPYTVRLEQIYAPSLQLTNSISARASLRPLLAQPAGTAETRPVGEFADVSRDLRDAPLTMDLNLSSVPDGAYALEVEVLNGAAAIGRATLQVTLQKGLDARLAALEIAAAAAPAAAQADIRYPADYLRRVNRGHMESGQFDLARELTTAETVAANAKGGRNPFDGKTGGFERHYVLAATGEIMPYRIFVPKTYDGSKAIPLVVALHGLGQTEDSWMDAYQQQLPTLAEKHGYIAVAPLGYRVDGFYGFSYGNDPAARRKQELSEQDVMQVLARVRQDYKVDASRIYLMGHSMGAIGTWFLAAKYPDVWAALGPIAGTGNPQSVERMRHIPQFVVHGDADATVAVTGSRNMVAALEKLGADHVYVEVPGGNHTDIVVPNLAPMFEFFATKRKAAVPTTSAQGRQAQHTPTFSKEVAPVLYKHCTTCHRPGEIAPMSVLTYEQARPWARAIRDHVRNGVMPPWHADPAHGKWANDRSMTAEEKDVIVKWVDGGAPEGNKRDLPKAPEYVPGWTIGRPDAIVTMEKEFTVPARGEVTYQYFEMQTNFTEDKWVQALEVRPGNREVVHHILVYARSPQPTRRAPAFRMQNPRGPLSPTQLKEMEAAKADPELAQRLRQQSNRRGNLIAQIAPGTTATAFAPGSAMLLQAGTVLTFQVHYTTNGAAATDRSSIGFKFAKDAPARGVYATAMMNPRFMIPAGAANHPVEAKMEFLDDVTIYSLAPHTHLRGKTWEYTLTYPDGRSEVILSVPKYDFNWQTDYVFATPLRVPKGSTLTSVAHYDNSKENRANPDATQPVYWGDQTWEEMQYTGIMYSIDKEARTPTVQQR